MLPSAGWGKRTGLEKVIRNTAGDAENIMSAEYTQLLKLKRKVV